MNEEPVRAGRVALLAGAAEGAGLATAVRLAASGMDIALVDPGPRAPAEEALRRIGATGRRCVTVAADPSDTAAFSAALAHVRSVLGRPSVLLTCVGGTEDAGNDHGGAAERYAAARRALRTLFVTNRAVAREMLRGGGRILNVVRPSSPERGGGRGDRTVVAGTAGFTASLAPELAPLGITVHFAAPAGLRPGARPPIGAPPPTDTGSYPDDIAQYALFLLDGPSAALSGQGAYLSGSPMARWPAPATTPTSRGTVATS
ncbi:SDR family NAD(P)-dependent oxidoreductase [Streptomyces sp. LaBMicrA B280]|uniref:SDR family NAD(P)-dependent oxidoreductase n=1 Tax=Streptomyces sp. LaBMicrA B280 TaxID=3391001 RepID=UPI003BA44B26